MSATRAPAASQHPLFEHASLRYAFAVGLVVAAFGLRILLEPLTGPGAPFVLFFGIVLICSVVAGYRAAILTAVLSVPVAAYAFIPRAGFSPREASAQVALYLIDCAILIYLSALVSRARRTSETSEERSRLAAAHFREIIELAPDAIFVADSRGRYTDANRAACRMLGYERDELVGKTIRELIAPDDSLRQAALVKSLATGRQSMTEWRLRKKDGTFLPVELSANMRSDGHLQAIVRDVTDRKRAEEDLRASEREFRSLAETMPQIVWATTADGLNTYFNRQWVDYTGLTGEASRGEDWIVPFHPDDRQRAWDAWQRATKHQDIYSVECRIRRTDGVYRWWLIRGAPVRDATGAIEKWFGTCTDIEDIKIAEQKLVESEAKFSGIISIAADAIIGIDHDEQIVIFNHAAEQMFGYSEAEVVGTPIERLLPGSLRHAGKRLATIAGRRKSGEEFPAEGTFSAFEGGAAILLTVALRDVSERKRNEKEQRFLAEAGTLLGSSIDYDQTLVSVAELAVRDFADWCIVDIVESEEVRRLKVVSADPARADVAATLQHIAIDRERPYLLRTTFEQKRPVLIEHFSTPQLEAAAQGPAHLEALRAMGVTSLMVLPLLRSGLLLGAVAFISSDPAHHYGPRDLRLAAALAERASVAIENARLFRAAVEAAEVRDQVLGFVAHDLRNPLNIIAIQAHLLRRKGSEPERRTQQPGERIERAAARMNRLIQDILDVSRMEGGHLHVDQERVPAPDILVDCVDAQKHLAAEASIELELASGALVPDVWADHDRVLQVFENLIGNAIKFTKAGGRVTVGATEHGRDVVFWVKDTGAGISADDLPHVFDRFWQAKKTRRAGAGLGLQIVKGIVEAHGGHIWVESTLGVGTTVYFTLPTALQAIPHVGQLDDGKAADR